MYPKFLILQIFLEPPQNIVEEGDAAVDFIRCGEAICTTQDHGQTWKVIGSDVQFSDAQNRSLTQIDFVNASLGGAVTTAACTRRSTAG